MATITHSTIETPLWQFQNAYSECLSDNLEARIDASRTVEEAWIEPRTPASWVPNELLLGDSASNVTAMSTTLGWSIIYPQMPTGLATSPAEHKEPFHGRYDTLPDRQNAFAPLQSATEATPRARAACADTNAIELNDAPVVQPLTCINTWDTAPDIINTKDGAINARFSSSQPTTQVFENTKFRE